MQLPILEHTNNDTGRLMIYHIQKGDTDHKRFFLYKTAVVTGGKLQPEGVIIESSDLLELHMRIVEQGFVPMEPAEEDDDKILKIYL